MPEINLKGMPTIPIEFKASTESAGLGLVDLYLWIFKRMYEGKDLPVELKPFVNAQMRYARTAEVSLRAIEDRWTKWERSIPQLDEFSEEQLAEGRELLGIDEGRRLASIARTIRAITGKAHTDV